MIRRKDLAQNVMKETHAANLRFGVDNRRRERNAASARRADARALMRQTNEYRKNECGKLRDDGYKRCKKNPENDGPRWLPDRHSAYVLSTIPPAQYTTRYPPAISDRVAMR